jgi:hypothetical protein
MHKIILFLLMLPTFSFAMGENRNNDTSYRKTGPCGTSYPLGKITSYGYKNDKTPDDNSRKGKGNKVNWLYAFGDKEHARGVRSSPEKFEYKTGIPSCATLGPKLSSTPVGDKEGDGYVLGSNDNAKYYNPYPPQVDLEETGLHSQLLRVTTPKGSFDCCREDSGADKIVYKKILKNLNGQGNDGSVVIDLYSAIIISQYNDQFICKIKIVGQCEFNSRSAVKDARKRKRKPIE